MLGKNRIKILFIGFLLFFSKDALSILEQTQKDLPIFERSLADFFEKSAQGNLATPLLVALPQAYFKESLSDFQELVYESIDKALKFSRQMQTWKVCHECDGYHVAILPNQGLMVRYGELSLKELQDLVRENQAYSDRKGLLIVHETPSGILTRLVSIGTGEVLFHNIADSSQTLDDVPPYLHYPEEKIRRSNKKPLLHVPFRVSVWPTFNMELSFLEQWGSYNQHVSGFSFSLVHPEFALGPSYHLLLRSYPSLDLGFTIYLPIQSVVLDKSELVKSLTLQLTTQYAFGKHYGLMAGVQLSKNPNIFLGFVFYNPVFLPFAL